MDTEIPPIKSREDKFFDDLYRENMREEKSNGDDRPEALPETPNFIAKCDGLDPEDALVMLLTHLNYEDLNGCLGRKFDIRPYDEDYKMSVEIRSYTMYNGNSIGVTITAQAHREWLPFRTKLNLEVFPEKIRDEQTGVINLRKHFLKRLSVFLIFELFILGLGFEKFSDVSMLLIASLLFIPNYHIITHSLLNSICFHLAKENDGHVAILKIAPYAIGAVLMLSISYLVSGIMLVHSETGQYVLLLLANLIFICTIPVSLAVRISEHYLNNLLPKSVSNESKNLCDFDFAQEFVSRMRLKPVE